MWLVFTCLQEFENAGIHLSVEGTLLARELNREMLIQVETGEKIVRKLLTKRFGNLDKLTSVTSEIVASGLQETMKRKFILE